MKFRIERVTLNGDETQSPCDEARQETYYDPKKAIPCLGVGEVPRWVMDFYELEELLEFTDKYGDIIIDGLQRDPDGVPHIIIYDSYIE